MWKLDLWALNQEDFTKSAQFNKQLEEHLNPALRKTILEIKHQMMKNGRVPRAGSYKLYKLIISGVHDKETLIKKLKQQGYAFL